MPVIQRIQEMLRGLGESGRLFPATILYNEGWLLRLVLQWFSQDHVGEHPFHCHPGARWFSEALLPSQFPARFRGDSLSEGWTHADGVIGHIQIGATNLADTQLLDGAKQLVVTEAKMFSPLSSGVRNARYFDQAARNVACMAEVLYRAGRSPDQMSSLGFFVVAPKEQIEADVFRLEMSVESIRQKVGRRASDFEDPKKNRWLEEWFQPVLSRAKIDCLSWENLIDTVKLRDAAFGEDLAAFYQRCLEFNRPIERGQTL